MRAEQTPSNTECTTLLRFSTTNEHKQLRNLATAATTTPDTAHEKLLLIFIIIITIAAGTSLQSVEGTKLWRLPGS